ncbi:MAG: fimbrillin family protein [Bacteroidales bacterium]|nr:fimbrillin family protein [Bacteroidales bacterium]
MKTNRIIKSSAFALIAIMSVSCSGIDDDMSALKDRTVAYDVCIIDQSPEFITRSIAMNTEGQVTLPMSLKSLDFNLGDISQTKGGLVNTAGSTESLEVYSTSLNSFLVSAVDESGEALISSSTPVTYSNGEWKCAEDYIWEDNKVLTFVASANLPQGDSVTMRYKYTDSDGYQLIAENFMISGDARSQRDMLLAYYKGDGRGSSIKSGGVAQMTFGHPMTSVEFKLGDVNREITGIKSISIENVYSKGTVTQIGSANYLWSDLSVSPTKTVTLAPKAGQNNLEVNSLTGLIGEPFVIIPQNFASLAPVIKVVVGTSTRGDVTLSATLDEGEWAPGKINTYTLSVSDERVDVEILEYVTGNVKSNVAFRNKGNCKSWMRAAIIANWYDSEGAIVGNWSENDTSSGTFSGLPGESWEKGSDGFYYYKELVNPGATTSNLFDSYTKKTASDRILKMEIIVQTVIYNNSKTYKTIWE